jgi:FKBP-type peptidyl-prolyl cis-trans isomerase FkpA
MQRVKQLNSQITMKVQQMKVIAMIFFSLLVFTACKDNNGCMGVKPEAEEPAMQAFAAANGMTAIKHPSGMYYQVIAQGSGPTPNLNSRVWVTYTGKHMDGTIFDQSTASPYSSYLNGLIEGWQIGLQLIQKGGHIKLIIPSSLAYGCSTTYSSMPPNSVLYFDIQLIDVQ